MAETRAEYLARLESQLAELDTRLYQSRLRVEEAESRFNLHVERHGSEERRRTLYSQWNEKIARHEQLQQRYGELQLKVEALRSRR